MRKKCILLCFLLAISSLMSKAAVYPSPYLSAIDFDKGGKDANLRYLHGAEWVYDASFSPGECLQATVCNDMMIVLRDNDYAELNFFFWDDKVPNTPAYVSNEIVHIEVPGKKFGWGVACDSVGNIVTVMNKNDSGFEPFDSFHVFKRVDRGKVKSVSSITSDIPNLVADINTKVGGFRYISAYGDLSQNGYIVACGGKPGNNIGTQYDRDYNVEQTHYMVKFDITGYKITSVHYYKDPLFFDNAVIYPINNNRVLVNSALLEKTGNTYDVKAENFVYRVYDFTMNNGKGGWEPEIVFPNGNDVKIGGIRKTAIGGCYVEIQGCKVYFYSTGERTGDIKSDEYKFSQFFTGYDYTGYDPDAENPIKNCYFYKNYEEPTTGMNKKPVARSFTNYILPYKVNENEYHIFHYCPDGNYVSCYKLYTKSRGEAFKGAVDMKLTPKIIKADYDVTDLEVNVEWLAPTDPEVTTKGNQVLLGYELDLIEFGVDKPVATVQVPKETLTYTFKGMKPLRPSKGIFADTPTEGLYTVRLRAQYKWSNTYNDNNLEYFFDSEDAVRECQPDYEVSDFVQNIRTKTIWVPESPFPGGSTPARAYTVIDFDFPAQASNKELPTFWRIYAEKDNVITEIDSIPGNFNFLTDKKNVSEFGKLPGGETFDCPYVAVHEVLNVPSVEIASKLGYKYQIEAVYADNSPAARKRVPQGPYEVIGDVPTSVENNFYNDLSVTPTLVDGLINIQYESGIKSVDIYSVAGSLVKHFEGSGNVYETLFVDELSKGTYFVKVNNYKVVRILKR